MTQPPTRVSRAEIEALQASITALAETIEKDRGMRKETHALVMGLHHALIEPEPGHAHGLLHRMAAVTIAAETGRAAGERIIWWSKVIGAASAIAVAAWTLIRLGHPPPRL